MRRGEKKRTAFKVISEGAKQSVLRQILLIFQVFFHPVSQTWLYFKSVLQDGAQPNLGELSRHQNPLLPALAAESTAGAQGFPTALLHFVDNQIKTCNPTFRSILGVIFPQIWQHRSLEEELQPSHLSALSLFSNPPLGMQKLKPLHKVHFFLLNIDLKPFFIAGSE